MRRVIYSYAFIVLIASGMTSRLLCHVHSYKTYPAYLKTHIYSLITFFSMLAPRLSYHFLTFIKKYYITLYSHLSIISCVISLITSFKSLRILPNSNIVQTVSLLGLSRLILFICDESTTFVLQIH